MIRQQRWCRAGLKGGDEKAPLNRMTLITLQMALGSSPAAAAAMLENLRQKRTLDGPAHQALTELADIRRTREKRRQIQAAPASVGGVS